MSLRFGLYNDAFIIGEEKSCTPVNIVVRNRRITVNIESGPMVFSSHVYEQTFVVEVDFFNEERNMANDMFGGGGGQMLCHDFAEAVATAAREFCQEKGWKVLNEINHWPKLQFIAWAAAKKEPYIVWHQETTHRLEGKAAIDELSIDIALQLPPTIILHSWNGAMPWSLRGTRQSSCHVDERFVMGFKLVNGEPVKDMEFVWPLRLADYKRYFPILGIQIL